jgi:menaquinone-dependent protoporphyrinogen oxidase
VPRILVLYGTTDGQTARIARALGDTLRSQDGDVDVFDARSTCPSPDGYDAVIVAASVHAGGYQRAVRQWVRAHAHALNGKPSAFVSVCLAVLQREPAVQQELTAIVDRFFAATGWHPTMTKNVAGALLYTRYNWMKRWAMLRIVRKAGGDTDTSRDYEYTDWEDLRMFAEQFGRLVCERGHESVHDRVRAAIAAAVALLVIVPNVWGQTIVADEWRVGTTLAGFVGASTTPGDTSATAGAALGWEIAPHFTLEGRGIWLDGGRRAEAFAALIGARVPLLPARSVVPFLSGGVGMYRATFESASDSIPRFYGRRMMVDAGRFQGRTFDDFVVGFGGGSDIFLARHLALRPEVTILLVTTRSAAHTIPVYGVHLAYHFESHPITPAGR